jgi:hypothetical protein
MAATCGADRNRRPGAGRTSRHRGDSQQPALAIDFRAVERLHERIEGGVLAARTKAFEDERVVCDPTR